MLNYCKSHNWFRQYNSLRWCHNERDGVSNHRHIECLLNRLFRQRSKKTSKLCVTFWDNVWLTHWGRATHIRVGNLTTIGSDNGLSPGRRQGIIWTNIGIMLIGPLGINFSEILIEILAFSFRKMRLKVSFAKWRPFCPGFKVLTLASPKRVPGINGDKKQGPVSI